ncbi:MAG: hypothetical protein ABI895_37500, partial [Deltaproteobacteria bacterium]
RSPRCKLLRERAADEAARSGDDYHFHDDLWREIKPEGPEAVSGPLGSFFRAHHSRGGPRATSASTETSRSVSPLLGVLVSPCASAPAR